MCEYTALCSAKDPDLTACRYAVGLNYLNDNSKLRTWAGCAGIKKALSSTSVLRWCSDALRCSCPLWTRWLLGLLLLHPTCSAGFTLPGAASPPIAIHASHACLQMDSGPIRKGQRCVFLRRHLQPIAPQLENEGSLGRASYASDVFSQEYYTYGNCPSLKYSLDRRHSLCSQRDF